MLIGFAFLAVVALVAVAAGIASFALFQAIAVPLTFGSGIARHVLNFMFGLLLLYGLDRCGILAALGIVHWLP